MTDRVLLLFDIDGTLMQRASAEHAASLLLALEQVHGVGRPHAPFETAGRTDLAIARTILIDAGVSATRIDDGAEEVRALTCEYYAQRCPDDLSAFLAPDVLETLDALSVQGRYILSLVTGNLETVARLKLKRAGIGHHFAPGQGGYGSDHEDRTELPPIARARADSHPRERTIVIGDTPRDIACARADRLAVIAIPTGPYERDALTGADVVIDSLAELPAALTELGV